VAVKVAADGADAIANLGGLSTKLWIVDHFLDVAEAIRPVAEASSGDRPALIGYIFRAAAVKKLLHIAAIGVSARGCILSALLAKTSSLLLISSPRAATLRSTAASAPAGLLPARIGHLRIALLGLTITLLRAALLLAARVCLL
jgi:hypothetical protein